MALAFLFLPMLHNWFLGYVMAGTPFVVQMQLRRAPSPGGVIQGFVDLGAEVTYFTLLPMVAWNVDLALGRRLAVLWALGFYATSYLNNLLRLPSPYHINGYIPNAEKRSGQRFGLPCPKAFSAACLPLYVALTLQGKVEYSPFVLFTLVFLWCFAVTSSGVCVGMHTPADAIAGICLGVAFALLWCWCGEDVDAAAVGQAATSFWFLLLYPVLSCLCIAAFPAPPFFSPALVETAQVLGFSIGWIAGANLLRAPPFAWQLSVPPGGTDHILQPVTGYWDLLLRSGFGLLLLFSVRDTLEPIVGNMALRRPLKIFRPRVDAPARAILQHSRVREQLLPLFAKYLKGEELSDTLKDAVAQQHRSAALSDCDGASRDRRGGPPDKGRNGHWKVPVTGEKEPDGPIEPVNAYGKQPWQRAWSTAVPASFVTYLAVGFTASFAAPLAIATGGM